MRLIKTIIKQSYVSPPAHHHHHHHPSSNSTMFFAKNVVIIIIVMFFICGVLHFLVRFFMNKIRLSSNSHHQSSGDGDSVAEAAVFQRQLQQLFNLHDSGLDQSTIDGLPVFTYKELLGFKEHHHCAVCLCEFTEDDSLRLLPVCSHAFHTHCIDTWLLSNSTCPLCRGSIFTPGFSVINPVFDFDFDLDFEHVHSREEEDDDHEVLSNAHDEVSGNTSQSERVYPVRLGKLRAIDGEKEDKQEMGQTSNGNLDERRCYSMGSYEYVVANSDLQVAFWADKGRIGNSDLRIEKDKMKVNNNNNNSCFDDGRNGKEISNGSKGESFSVSKIWLWSKKGDHKFQDSSTHICSYPLSM